MAALCAAAWFDEALFGPLLHPYRDQYPNDVQIYWHNCIRRHFNKPNEIVFVAVTTENGKEKVVGAGVWQRQGDDAGAQKVKETWKSPGECSRDSIILNLMAILEMLISHFLHIPRRIRLSTPSSHGEPRPRPQQNHRLARLVSFFCTFLCWPTQAELVPLHVRRAPGLSRPRFRTGACSVGPAASERRKCVCECDCK